MPSANGWGGLPNDKTIDIRAMADCYSIRSRSRRMKDDILRLHDKSRRIVPALA
jgi:hypothetical protein